ncbi:hypothetical protein llap_2665 [Limosa lapponica baueri]|uniref:Uncharacterized protein n=1 Tax=Limosa lapponica baueri TaxID=1758121 RepID=A0A2I0ULU3_LIMLA|nr:hypothetical protein llap_2665 [Limosa lapponica baueri]
MGINRVNPYHNSATLRQATQDTPREQLHPERPKRLLGGGPTVRMKKLTLWYLFVLAFVKMRLTDLVRANLALSTGISPREPMAAKLLCHSLHQSSPALLT